MPQNPIYPPVKPPKKNLHPRADEGSPVALRALAALQREQPTFPKGVQVEDMPFDDIKAWTNVNGAVDPDRPDTIRLNPVLSMLYPENVVKRTLAHEGQHVNQLRAGKGAEMAITMRTTPYEHRAHEEEANMVADSYNIPQPPIDSKEWIPYFMGDPVLTGLFNSSPLHALRRRLGIK